MICFSKTILLAVGCLAAVGSVPMVFAQTPVTDLEWNTVANEIIQEAERDRPIAERLFKILPQMKEALKTDSQRPYFKGLWGLSLNFDEHAHSEIVHPKIISWLSQEVGVPLPDGERVFAGIEHTYGYLLSTLKTEFGHKRLRWIQGEIEGGLGLPIGTLGPFPQVGTLFGNATYFFGRIAFRGDDAVLSRLSALKEGLPKSLIDYPYDRLVPLRIIEEVKLDPSRWVRLRTDLVPFMKKVSPGNATHLLLYSVEDSRDSAPRLISGFPVGDGMVKFLTAPESMGENVSVTTHYNAFVEGLSGRIVKGVRKLW